MNTASLPVYPGINMEFQTRLSNCGVACPKHKDNEVAIEGIIFAK